MSIREREIMRMTWPVVVIVVCSLAALVVMYWLADPESRSVVIAGLMAAIGSLTAVLVQRLNTKIERLHRRTESRAEQTQEDPPDADV